MRGIDVGRRLKRTGRTQTALAEHLGISTFAMSRLARNERDLDVGTIEKIDAFFGTSESDAAPPPRRIPIYGYAAAGDDERVSIAGDHVLEWAEIPHDLIRGDAFGIRVAGESMEPRLFSGETVLVSRNVTPRRYGDCVVELKDGSALVKTYMGTRDGWVFLHQYNPDKELRVELSKVRAIHAAPIRR